RKCSAGPGDQRAAEQRDELPPSHFITPPSRRASVAFDRRPHLLDFLRDRPTGTMAHWCQLVDSCSAVNCVYGSATRLSLSSITLGSADCAPAYRQAVRQNCRRRRGRSRTREKGDRKPRDPASVAEGSAAEPDAASSFELAKEEQPHPQTAQAQNPKTHRHMSGNQRFRRRRRREVFELLRQQSSVPPLREPLCLLASITRRLFLIQIFEQAAYPS